MSMVGEFNFNDKVWITHLKTSGTVLGVAFFTYMNPQLFIEYFDGQNIMQIWARTDQVTKIVPAVVPINSNVAAIRKTI